MAIDRSGKSEDEERPVGQIRGIAGELQPARSQRFRGELAVAVDPAADLAEPLAVGVEPDGPGEFPRQGRGHGETHVAQADDGDAFAHGYTPASICSSEGTGVRFQVTAAWPVAKRKKATTVAQWRRQNRYGSASSQALFPRCRSARPPSAAA